VFLVFSSHNLIINEKSLAESISTEILFLGRIGTGGDSYDIQVVDGIAYVTCGYSGLKIFNISDPSNLIELGDLPESYSGYAHQFFIDFPLMFIGDGRGGLHIVNVSNPTNPSSLFHYADFYSWDVKVIDENESKIAFVGNGFMGDQNSGLAILDITDPINPVLLGQIKTGGDVTDLQVIGKKAVLMDGVTGLTVINVSSYSDPTIQGQKSLNGQMGALKVIEDIVFTVNYQEGLKIINISDLTDINLISEYSENMSSTWDVKIDLERDLAYVVDTDLGLKIIDIKKLEQPVLIAEYSDESSRYNNVFVSGDRIYLNTNLGLTILDLKMNEINSSNTSLTDNGTNEKTTEGFSFTLIGISLLSLIVIKRKRT
jgi:hypothetical protein